MTKRKPTPVEPPESDPRKITVRFNANCTRLYGPIPQAIAYLQEVMAEHPDAELNEHWSGYEDMDMVFEYDRLENPEELEQRLAEARYRRELDRAADASARRVERHAKLKKYDALKKELGL